MKAVLIHILFFISVSAKYKMTKYMITENMITVPLHLEESSVDIIKSINLQDAYSYLSIQYGDNLKNESIFFNDKIITLKTMRTTILLDTFHINWEYLYPSDVDYWLIHNSKKGIGFGYQNNQSNTFTVQMKNQNIIDRAIFAFYPDNKTMYFGDIPHELISNKYSLKCDLNSKFQFGCNLNGVIFSQKNHNDIKVRIQSVVLFQSFGGYLQVPYDFSKYLNETYFSSFFLEDKCDYIEQKSYYQNYHCDCEIKRNFPDITLLIDGKHLYLSKEILFKERSGICHFIIYSTKESEQWIFEPDFITQYITVFDNENGSVTMYSSSLFEKNKSINIKSFVILMIIYNILSILFITIINKIYFK